MTWIVRNLWLIPAIPFLAAGLSAFARRRSRVFSASVAIGSMTVSLLLSVWAFAHVWRLIDRGQDVRQVVNFPWFQFGSEWLRLGWILDPLTAIMLLTVTAVGLLIFVYSLGYMAQDANFTRFFCFMSLFAGAMLGVVLANSLLLLFMNWELVGLASYLLIGFWYHKPSAAAAAKKAFIVTKIGDLAFLIGMVWLYAQAGTLLFYDGGTGCLEQMALLGLAGHITSMGMAASTGVALLIFCGAAGKSGQVPLHVWLPDAMEGPTPVSALIHAATMVAAGVFLVARVYPLMSAHVSAISSGVSIVLGTTTALKVVTWVGAITAIFAASIAVAQNDIKRILAYSTVSQLGYMMMGLGAGGVAVGMFHLITHACFKAVLFLGAGSVIHGCHEEQDIRRMGGLRRLMPVTFATYAVGMLALSGFPLFFSGFWSKDEILHAASLWSISKLPFYLGLIATLLTAFYMTRQVCYIFFGTPRINQLSLDESYPMTTRDDTDHRAQTPHESAVVMTAPLILLAIASILLGVVGTPAWPWFHGFLAGKKVRVNMAGLLDTGMLATMLTSSLLVFLGIGLGWRIYGRKHVRAVVERDPLEGYQPRIFAWLQCGFYVDSLYQATIVRFNSWWAKACDWLERWIWSGAVEGVAAAVVGLSKLSTLIDKQVVNRGFDGGCMGATGGGRMLSRLQSGQGQNYLRIAGVGLVALILFLMWGGKG